ncbi:MAG: ABC transporter ATP-binding protein [Deltaproteobacteria bacterium GWA2_38_16]|nr:MAG: ABC transporter ATP-binding protein [Deltaproteobacteria bacterium GWA2_38_16]OGQ03834.1 MAG: ABC transporter ATP-binding protein [Deltaproteobacteria bacterium RIFCSPHIGHO2_02_FULL_38_15]OGQ31508.1 MAG: ABC transporter ATP-binding protein [Deltaproteobacteria bacterium RIFCSPLOWO2_01_FULL_38_9]OGQ63925.1 MAG: ABC transporter ATP-binding protein [Deltaproteobacteria bacterium RIFCSPLOWO2_12_FULL_38_8]HBQ20879.1 lipoprotein-releasing system ATP-binding protein LolD [Deltaproteobacteria b
MNDLLRVEKLHKSFWIDHKEIQVIKNVSFQAQEGEMISIVGASGAGKSTLLHILGALDRPTSGEVFFENESLFQKRDTELSLFRNKKVGFIFQFHHLLPEFNAVENVMMPALISGMNKNMARGLAEKKLEEVGLSHRLRHKPGELSGGEQQRVAISRALMLHPKLLLADELTGNLDTKTGEQIQELLLGLNQTYRMTVIVVTHNEALAQRLPKRFQMVDGNLLYKG